MRVHSRPDLTVKASEGRICSVSLEKSPYSCRCPRLRTRHRLPTVCPLYRSLCSVGQGLGFFCYEGLFWMVMLTARAFFRHV